MKENRVRRVWREGRVALGMQIMEFGTRGIAKILEFSDADFVLIDMEHSAFGIERVADLIAWFKATDIAPIVRVPENLYHYLAGVLDAGAAGVQVASVETAEQARSIIQAVKYAPEGNRGLGLTAAHSDFRPHKASEYLPFMNRQTIVITQIETLTGLANCEEIAAVDGIDVLAVGANDMTFSLGIQGQYDHPLLRDAMEKVIAACKKHGKIGKCHPHHTAQIAAYAALGYTMMMGSSDVAIMRQGARSTMDELRKHLGDAAAPK